MYMDEDTELLLDYLRKRSRTLLAYTETNSKKIDNEIQRLRWKSLTLRRQNSHLRDRKEIWNLRNNSSAINNLLCPENHSETKNLTRMSVPNMRPLERIVIPSKNLSHSHCSCVVSRKPVKECYCNVEIKKIQTRSPRTIHKPIPPCNYSKNHIGHIPLLTNDNNIGDTLSPPISCETIRRVKKINYYPQSQFLRNVQKKVSVLKNVPSGDCPDSCPRSSYYHKLMADKTSMVMDTDTRSKIITEKISKPSIIELEKLNSTQRVPSSLMDEEEEEEKEEEEEEEETEKKIIEKVSKGIQVPSRKQSKAKFQVKRTISSKKCISEGRKDKSVSRSSSISKNTIRSSTVGCQCYDKNKVDKFTKDLERKKSQTYRVYPENYEEVDQRSKKWSSHEKEDQRETLTSSSRVKELKKFREQNYFDTHGSSQTLLSSESSKSLQQYTLNERLFAEPYKRIHKKDLVVTMPPCATIQKKRIHYFPRYIVRQEKNNCNTNYKKKRCQSCPLTGHAIDLGISKPRPVLNSLALKYQKRLP